MSWVRYNAAGKKFEGSADNGATWVALDLSGQGLPAGNVVGPASATDGHLAVYDGTTGKLLKDGGAVPTGNVTGPASATSGHLAGFDGTTGKALKDSGVSVDGSGNVGIGTDSPGAALEILRPGTGYANIRLKSAAEYGQMSFSDNDDNFDFINHASWVGDGSKFRWFTNGDATTPKMVLNRIGQLGIGVSPAAILHTNGQVRFAGLPTSASGLGSGDIWIDTSAGNVLKIVS